MANKISNSIVLSGHSRVSRTRHMLALVNFIAVLFGTAITLFFLTKRGCSDTMLYIMYGILALNIMQVAVCVVDFVLKWTKGVYIKWLPFVSYGLAALWVIAVLGEMLAGTSELGELRTDLAIVAVVQFVVAFVAYVVWPVLDRRAIGAMTAKKIRDNEAAKLKKAKGYVIKYAVICVAIVLLQVCALLIYKLPPTLYDLFDESRAIKYASNEGGDGYIVVDVYRGTSSYLNIPAEYNGKPVVGIAEGAIDQTEIIDRYKIDEIVFGTLSVDENGNETLVSNLQYIESGAIVNDRISSIVLPASVGFIGPNAISSTSLQTLTYESKADFNISALSTPSLSTIVMQGESVGKIASLSGMSSAVSIEVDKSIYNEYREANIEYESNFSPILPREEFYVDFFTGCDYYLDSLFCTKGDEILLTVDDLISSTLGGIGLKTDTVAYIRDRKEMNTSGIKEKAAFRGWYYDPEFTTPCEFTLDGAVELRGNTKLYAKWVEEFYGDLNWGHTPVGVATNITWTEEDDYNLPNYLDRAGYDAGVRWVTADNSQDVTDTTGLMRDVDFTATWQLDAPEIDILCGLIDEDSVNDYYSSVDGNTVQVTYDEAQRLRLEAEANHDLARSGNGVVDYEYSWSINNEEFDINDYVQLQNVAQSGTYTLTVTAYAEDGEISEASTDISITINRKDLNLGDAKLIYTEVEYNGAVQTLECANVSSIVSQNVIPTYRYYDYSGDTKGDEVTVSGGVREAGTYLVEVLWKKSDTAEAANYNTKTFSNQFVIKQKAISGDTWSNTSFVYDSNQKTVTLAMKGKCGSDDVRFVYTNNTKTNAGSYTATITGLEGGASTNYYLAENTTTSHEWVINQHEVSIVRWELDGNTVADTATASTVYSGGTHRVQAVMSIVYGSDTVNFVYSGTVNANNVSTYSAVVTGVDNANYFFNAGASNAEREWSITKKQLTVTFTGDSGKTYSAKAQGVTASVEGFVSGEAQGFGADVFTYTGSSMAGVKEGASSTAMSLSFEAINAGSYNVAIDGTSLANYSIVGRSTSFSISKRGISFALVGENTDNIYATYNGEKQYGTWTVDGFYSSDLNGISMDDFTVKLGGIQTNDVSGSVSGGLYQIRVALSDAATNAGSYEIEFGGFTHDNYEIKNETQINTLNVAKKTIGVAWSMQDKTGASNSTAIQSGVRKTYNGEHYGYDVFASATGVIEGDEVNLTLSGDTHKAVAGNYNTTVSLVEHQNYKMDSASISWAIDPKEVSLVWTLDNQEVKGFSSTITYDGKTHSAPASVPEGELCDGDGSTLAVVYETSYGSKRSADTYIIKVSGIEDNANYTVKASTASFTLTIQKAKITLSSSWLLDGSAYSTPTYSGKTYTVTTTVASGLFGSDTVTISYEGNQATDASDKYTAKVTGISNSNYTLDGVEYSFNWSIDKKVIGSVDVSGTAEFTFNNTEHVYTPSISSTDVVSGEDAMFELSGNKATNAGSYKATFKINNPNYTLASGLDKILPWTINTCWVNSHRFHDTTFTYNGASQHPIFSSTMCGIELAAAEYELYDESGKKIAEAVNAGTYEIKITALDNPNFHMTGSGITADFTIAKKSISLSNLNWSAQSFVYNGEAQIPTASYEGENNTITWEMFTKTLPESPINVGGYIVSVTGVSNDNYNISTALSYSYTIDNRQITSLAWDGDVFTYNGSEHHPTAHYMYNGQRISVTTMSFSASPINAGSYTATATGVDNGNFVLASGLTHSFTINPLTIDVIIWEGGTYQYDGAEHYPTAYFSYGSERIDVTAYDKNTSKNVGTYTVTATGVNNSNFVLKSGLTKEYSITPYSIKGGEISWSADSFVYNGRVQYPAPSFSFAGASVQFTMGAATSKNAGSYSVTLTGINGNSNFVLDGTVTKNYEIKPYSITASDLVWTAKSYVYNGAQQMPTASCTYNSETLSWDKFSKTAPSDSTNVGEHTVTVTGISDSNYAIASAISYTYKIEPYQITTLSWEGTEFEYDGTQKSPYAYFYFNAQPTGIRVNVSNITYNATPINVGNYTATATAVDNSNFVLSGGLTHSFKVTPRIISVLTWSNDEFVFDGSEHYPSAYFTYGGEDISVSTYDKKTAKDAGTYTITATGVANSNFALSSGLTHTYQITPHIITGGIAWSSNSFVYNGSIRFPDASYVYNGITVEIATDVATSIDVGDYSIVARSVRNNNNFKLSTTFTYEYSITPYTITADEITWDTTTFEYTYNGKVQSPKASFSFNGVSVEFNATGDTDSKDARRSYKVTLTSVNGNSNFVIGGTGTISKDYSIQAYTLKASDVIWSASEYVFNGKAQRPTASITIFGDSISVTGYNGEETVNAGEYTVTLTAIDSENVKLPDGGISHSYTIKAKGITSVNWLHFGFNYNGTEQPMTADYVDPELGGHVSFIISTDRTPIDVGTYTATVIGVDGNTNYEIVGNIQTTYDIFPMRFDNVSTDFDMSTFQFTFTVDDAVSGDDVRILFKLYKDGVEVDKVDGPGYYEAKFVGLTGADAANYSYRGDEVLVFEEISQESWDEVTGGSDQGND